MLPRSCFWILLFFVSVFATVASAGERFLGVERARIERIIAMGYAMDLGTADEIESLAAEYPDSPIPGVLEAGYLYWMQNYSEWDDNLKKRFEDRSEVALARAEAYLKEHRKEADAQFAVALVELMQVIYFVDNDRYWAAFWKSRSSIKVMKRLLADDPDYADAKMPLGMANCYLSKTPAYLKPLAFLMRFNGDWELGLRYMKEARDGGLFCRVDAGYYLGAIYMELMDNREATRGEFAKLVEEFPRNLKFQSTLAELDRILGRQEAARDRSSSLLEDPRMVGFPAIELHTLKSLLWSSLASNSFDMTVATATRMSDLVAGFEKLAAEGAWADYARAEALLGLGRREEALAVWTQVSSSDYLSVAAAAQGRLDQVGSE